jgi:hypothetical protein
MPASMRVSGQPSFGVYRSAPTALRRRMIEDMTARNLGRHSRRNYLNSCARLAAFLKRSPEFAFIGQPECAPRIPY